MKSLNLRSVLRPQGLLSSLERPLGTLDMTNFQQQKSGRKLLSRTAACGLLVPARALSPCARCQRNPSPPSNRRAAAATTTTQPQSQLSSEEENEVKRTRCRNTKKCGESCRKCQTVRRKSASFLDPQFKSATQTTTVSPFLGTNLDHDEVTYLDIALILSLAARVTSILDN